MQGEENVNITIDTDVLSERDHGRIAWSDGYDIHILTEKSRRELDIVDGLKQEKRSILKQELFLQYHSADMTAEELIRNRMNDVPIFDNKTDYYSLNSIETNPGPGIGAWIGIFISLGILGYFLARYSIKRRKEREGYVYYRNHTAE